jgi:hypothetical protein
MFSAHDAFRVILLMETGCCSNRSHVEAVFGCVLLLEPAHLKHN